MAGEGHFTHRGKQAAVAAVVVGQDLALGAQLVDGGDQAHDVLRIVQIRHLVAHLVQRLRQDAGTHAHAPAAQINQQQRGVGQGGVELRREGAAHIGQRGKGGHDQADRRDDFFGVAAVLPLGTHRQRILADRDRDAQRRAELHAHRPHGFKQRGVLAGFATGRHPVGRQLDARQLHRRGQQVGDGLAHRHAARRRRVDHGQRRALAQAHGLAGKALEIGQGDRAIRHRHLPGPDHLVTVAEPAHRAVADRDQKPLGRHRRMRQHGNRR